jgi:hypothetical protein
MHNSGASRREIAEVCGEYERATLSVVIAREGGRPSIPETSVIEPRSRGVLDTPHARGMTVSTSKRRVAAINHKTIGGVIGRRLAHQVHVGRASDGGADVLIRAMDKAAQKIKYGFEIETLAPRLTTRANN